MKTRCLPLLCALLVTLTSPAQDFPFGAVSLRELSMVTYAPDTSAAAVVLKEFGQASIDNGDDYNLIFRYHSRIKVLKKGGIAHSDIEIPLQKNGNRYEKLIEIKASAFNLVDGKTVETPLPDKNIYHENRNKYLDVKKLAIANVREGTVIELSYAIQSPFIFNFRSWDFQSDIPKVESEYWASIPGVYIYNITLRGFLKLSKNESSIVKGCLGTGQDPRGFGFSADCAIMKLGMKDIPAFVEEDYMTAKKNFISSIHFELSEVRHPDGRIDKVTKEWKDADQELRQDSRFGAQLKKGKDIGEEIERITAGETDELAKAKKVYNFVRDWYVWNDTYGKYSEYGIRKAFDDHKGNVGDINLSLIAGMRYAGLDAEPVILSTRNNGIVVELHPVLSEFNYVIAKVNIGDKVYLADATAKYHPFGLLPERCLNGKGRVLADRESYWLDLKPNSNGKTISHLSLVLGVDGIMRGKLQTTYMGYDAVTLRKEILAHSSHEEYIKDLKNSFTELEIQGFALRDVEDIEKPIVRTLDIELRAFEGEDVSNFMLNPFLFGKWSKNPFKSRERLYPVDFGVPLERITILNLEYPPGFEILNMPEKVGLSLPDGGGRFLFEANNTGNKLALNNSLAIRKTVFSSSEYHYLKELFDRILQIQNGELLFRKKS